MNFERLNQLGHLLESAGSDAALISFNVPDAQLLAVHDIGPSQTFKFTDKRYVYKSDPDPAKAGYVLEDVTVEIPAVRAEINPATQEPFAYIVCVGLARKALKKLLNGRPLTDLRMPDVQSPKRNEEAEEPELVS